MQSRLPLVGRTTEVDTMQHHVARLACGEGGIILIGGEAGIGKTTLVNHVLQSDSAQQSTMLACRCPGPGETPAYGPWREALLQLQEPEWDTSPLPAPFGASPAVDSPYEIALSLLRWFKHHQQPLILTLEDLQWSDSASLELLRHLSGRLTDVPALIFGIYRSEDLRRSPELRRVCSDMLRTGSKRVLLSELTRADVETLTRMCLPELTDHAQLAIDIYRQTQGLPLFVVELLEEVRRTKHTSLPATETVQQAIDEKLQLMLPLHVPVLEAAAQIGEQFTYSVLVEVVDAADEVTTTALEEAMQLGFIWHVAETADSYQFRHAIVRSVLMNRMLGGRRLHCHRLIAAAYEAKLPHAVDSIGFHYGQAQDARAIPHLTAAGDKALQMGALPDAEQRYRQALELLAEADEQRGELLLKLGFSIRRKDEAEAARYYKHALGIAITKGDLPLQAWAQHLLAERAYMQGDVIGQSEMTALSALQEQLLDEHRYQQLERLFYGDVCGYPRIRFVHWGFLYAHGEFGAAEALLKDLQSRTGSHNAHVLGMRARLSAFMGRLSESTEIVRQTSYAAYRRRDYWNTILLFTNYLYHSYLHKSNEPETIDAIAMELIRLESEARTESAHAFLPGDYSAAGFYYYTRGNWKAARHHLIDYVLSEPAPDPLMAWFAAMMLVEIGDFDTLDHVLTKLLPLHPSTPPPATTTVFTWVHAVRAQAHLAKGELSMAKSWLDAADAHPLGPISKLHRPLIDIARTDYYMQIGHQGAAFETCRRALAWAESVPIQWFVIKAQRRLGLLEAHVGEYQDALAHLETAATLAETCQLVYEAALTHLAAGQVLVEAASIEASDRPRFTAALSAQQHLEVARDTFARLGARELVDAESWLEKASAAQMPATRGELDGLTQRELEVAELVAVGLTDKEIAAQLFVSPRTVDHHLRNIFRKLDIRHRTALAARISGR